VTTLHTTTQQDSQAGRYSNAALYSINPCWRSHYPSLHGPCSK